MLDQVKGFLSNLGLGKAGTAIFYPYNSLLTDYGIGKNSQVFSVRIVAFAHPDTFTGASGVNNVPPTKLAEFEIIQCTPSVTLNHSHNYGGDSWLHGFINGVNGSAFMGLDLSTIANMVSTTMSQIEGKSTAIQTPWNTFGGFDLASAYQGSTAPSFSVDFNLVTHNNPLTDVVIPSVLLSYLSYPKIDKMRGTDKLVEVLSNQTSRLSAAISTFAGALGNTEGTAENTVKEAINITQKGLTTAATIAKNLSAGKWRHTVGTAPPYWTLRCSNGIYGMMNASLADVSITYNGPWIEATNAGIVGQLSTLLSNTGMTGLNPSSVLSSATSGLDVSAVSDFFKGGANKYKGYPTSANVKLTFVNNYSKVFGEEIISSMQGHQGGKLGINVF